MENTSSVKNNDFLAGELFCEREMRLAPVTTGVDYILPDYMGEVRKVLKSSAKVIPSGRFIGGGEVSFIGAVYYRVLYLDGENKLTEAAFTSDYEISEKTEDNFMDAECMAELASLSVRPAGPRKISAKATLVPKVYIAEDRMPKIPEGMGEMKVLRGEVSQCSVGFLRSGEREYAEEGARLEGVAAEEVEVCFSDGEISLKAERGECGCSISGEANLYAVLLIGDETSLRVETSIPISENMDCEGISHGACLIPEAYITSQKVTLNNCVSEEGGEIYTSVTFNITVEYKVCVYDNKISEVALDAFSCDRKYECKYKDWTYKHFEGCVTEKRNIAIKVDKPECECGEIGDILSTEGKVKVNSAQICGDGLMISGEIEFLSLMQVSGEGGYYVCKNTAEFSEEFKLPSARVNLSAEPRVERLSAETTVDASSVYHKCLLCFTVPVKSEKSAKILSSVELFEKEERDMGCSVTVAYLREEDTLWSVAKKYGVCPEVLAEENSLSAECMADGGNSCPIGKKSVVILKNIK